MPKFTKVKNSQGVVECEVERDIARQMVVSGDYVWWDRCKSVRALNPTRSSDQSRASLGMSDAVALAGQHFPGGELSRKQRERLSAWGLV